MQDIFWRKRGTPIYVHMNLVNNTRDELVNLFLYDVKHCKALALHNFYKYLC